MKAATRSTGRKVVNFVRGLDTVELALEFISK